MSIEITNRIIDKKYHLKRQGQQSCSNCHNGARVLYDYENLPYSLCELCNTVFRYSTKKMSTGIICYTDMEQIDIIKQTYEFIKTNKRVPRISELDKSAKIINHPFPDILKALKSATKDQRAEFSKLKLFFTDMIDYSGFPFASMFWRVTKYPEYKFFDVVKQESGKIDLTLAQVGIIELYVDSVSIDSQDDDSKNLANLKKTLTANQKAKTAKNNQNNKNKKPRYVAVKNTDKQKITTNKA